MSVKCFSSKLVPFCQVSEQPYFRACDMECSFCRMRSTVQKQPFRGNPHLFSVSSPFFHPSLFTIISVFFAFFPTRSYFSSPGFLPRFLFPLSSVFSLQTISFYSFIHALSVNMSTLTISHAQNPVDSILGMLTVQGETDREADTTPTYTGHVLGQRPEARYGNMLEGHRAKCWQCSVHYSRATPHFYIRRWLPALSSALPQYAEEGSWAPEACSTQVGQARNTEDSLQKQLSAHNSWGLQINIPASLTF